jgi:hypothetical protein
MGTIALSYEPSGSQSRPWIRWASRIFDLYLFSFLTGIILELLYPSALTKIPDKIWEVFLIFIYVFVEPVMLCSWGTTPGKELLRIRLRRQNGTKLSYSQALSRSFSVWIKGLGLGIPLVSLFTLVSSYNHLTKKGVTTWDRDGNFSVSHRVISPVRGTIIVLFFIIGALFWSGLDMSNMLGAIGTRGEDLRLDVKLGFHEAIFGSEKEIRIQHLELISRGKVAPVVKELTVTTPAGVDSGTRLRVTGEGDASPDGGQSGDLYVYLEVPPKDGAFRREGFDIISELKITAERARKGEKIRVNTIDGEATIVIPPGTGRGDCLKVPGHGVPKLGSPDIRGNHIVCLKF